MRLLALYWITLLHLVKCFVQVYAANRVGGKAQFILVFFIIKLHNIVNHGIEIKEVSV